MKLIECVPNFSEGRDPEAIRAITVEIEAVPDVKLLDVDPGQATNRTVVTFVGPPEAVLEAAFRAIRKAAEVIDMRHHQGEHPRMGATDVCPFVPVQGATMDDCVELAHRLGRRVGEELGIPVYLYGHAATRPERRRLPDIRKGEYEALPEKLEDPAFKPDYGPAEFNAKAGATVIGARDFLIAWNVNLNTRDKKLANKIAAELRETGKPKRGPDGKLVRDEHGRIVRIPGRFRELQGAGWYIEEYGRAQISFNLTHYKITPLHTVFDACREEAAKLGLRVTGSELVGLVPLEAILMAGDHYLRAQGKTSGVPEAERVRLAAVSLGLHDLGPFDPQEKIIEYKYRGEARGLRALRLTEFADELSSDSPAPGGGSVAALCGALSASLSSMVAALTHAKKGLEGRRPRMEEIGRKAQALKDSLLQAVDEDNEAFLRVLEARRLPRKTDEEIQRRAEALERANQEAAGVPLRVLKRAVEALRLAQAVAAEGLPASLSDAGVAAAVGLASAEGASMNVRINLPALQDRSVAEAMENERAAGLDEARRLAAAILEAVNAGLEEAP